MVQAGPSPASVPAVALTAIRGLGPGLSRRLMRLGYRTVEDLSAADADALKGALGEVSRLFDVERWISDARGLARQESPG